MGTAIHYGSGTKKNLDGAVEMFSIAKKLYEERGGNAFACDITEEEFFWEWHLLNQDAGGF